MVPGIVLIAETLTSPVVTAWIRDAVIIASIGPGILTLTFGTRKARVANTRSIELRGSLLTTVFIPGVLTVDPGIVFIADTASICPRIAVSVAVLGSGVLTIGSGVILPTGAGPIGVYRSMPLTSVIIVEFTGRTEV